MLTHEYIRLTSVFFLSFLIQATDGYSKGAPGSTCLTRYPKHNHRGTQTSVCPFTISTSQDTYTPGQEITITIQDAATKLTFSGFQIAAFMSSTSGPGTTEEIVGTFTTIPEGKAKLMSCFPGYKNMATHSNKQRIQRIDLKWRAPLKNVGNIIFRATIVENYLTFWTNAEKQLEIDPSVTQQVAMPTYPDISATSLVKNINLDECGETKGCLLYPRHCTGNNCVTAVSFQYRNDTDDFLFEMITDAAENYVSVAFSTDIHMGNDETVTCVAQDGEMSIQHGFNPAYYNEKLLNRYLSNTEIKQADGNLHCRFVIPRKTYIYRREVKPQTVTYKDLIVEKDERLYIHLAWGHSMPDSNVITLHKEMPAVSNDKVDMREIKVHRSSAFHTLVQVHAAVMMVGWIFLSGIVTVLSRHYKDWMPSVRICNTKVWFQLHRALAIMILILTGIGLAVIFAHYGPEIRKTAKLHAYVGLSVAGAVGVQIIAGLLRPDPKHKLRPIFNWGHRFLGQASHILAAVTMFLAFDIDYITKEMRFFGFVVLGIWVGVQLLWHLMFEVLKCRRRGKSFDLNSQSLGDKSLSSDESRSDTILFVMYVLTLAVICVAALLAFLLF